MLARPAMSCGSQCHHISQTMPSDVITDTIPCLPSNPSSRPHLVIISYRTPDDTAMQSITDDTGYDDIPLPLRSSPRPHLIASLLPAPLSASPCRPTGRIKTRRHPTRYPYRLVSPVYCLASSHRLISRPVLLPAERPASPRPA